jgi:hypothetical protein
MNLTSMDEKQFLLTLLYATDTRSHAGPGIENRHTYQADTYAWIAKAERTGHAVVRNGRAIITDEGRQRLLVLTGKPLYPIPRFPES